MLPTILIFIIIFLLEQPFSNATSMPNVKNSMGVLGVPCSNRTVWDNLYVSNSYIQMANEIKSSPMPPWSDEVYLLFNKKGDRSGQRMLWDRQDRLPY